jgi:hypothetical protein
MPPSEDDGADGDEPLNLLNGGWRVFENDHADDNGKDANQFARRSIGQSDVARAGDAPCRSSATVHASAMEPRQVSGYIVDFIPESGDKQTRGCRSTALLEDTPEQAMNMRVIFLA